MKKVLLLDDARSIRTIFKQFIEEAGYNAQIASNAQEGLQMIEDGIQPDLIITDLNMPGMNGIQFSKCARASLQDIPILVMSSDSDIKVMNQAMEAGVTGWMLKPVAYDLFVDKLHQFLG